MIIRHNREETAEIKAINAKYADLIAAAQDEWVSLLDGDEPDGSIFDDLTPDSAEWKDAEQKYNKALDEWESSGGEAAIAAENKVSELVRARHAELVEVDKKAMRRQFDKIKGDHTAIFEDFKRKTGAIVRSTYKAAAIMPDKIVEVYVSPKNIKKMVKAGLPLHYEAEKDNTAMLLKFDNYIEEYLTLNPYDKDKASKGAPRRSRASITDELAEVSDVLAAISNPKYQYALTQNKNDTAYTPELKPEAAKEIQYAGGKAYLASLASRVNKELNEVDLMDITTRETVTNVDRTLLRILYSVIITEYEKHDPNALPDSITIYAPDLAKAMGIQGGANREYSIALADKINSFSKLCGVLRETNDDGTLAKELSFYPVMNFMGYSGKDNTVKMGSPFMKQLYKALLSASIKRDKKGLPQIKRNGEPLRAPMHSYLVYNTINKERNKAAVENVFTICLLIEQSGNYTATIKASTMIDRNPELKQRLKDIDKRNQNRLLKTTFQRTWELLADPSITKLSSVYQGIELPDPNDPAQIPTMKTLEKAYSFPHKGKNGTSKLSTLVE